MKIKPLAQAKTHLSALVAPDRAEPILITRNGRPAAVLVPVPEDADIEDLALSFSPAFREIIESSRKSLARGEGIALDKARRILEEEMD